jgi:hypothetical protein
MKIRKGTIEAGIEAQKRKLDALLKDGVLEQIMRMESTCTLELSENFDWSTLKKPNFKKEYGEFNKDDSAVYIISAPGFSLEKKSEVDIKFSELTGKLDKKPDKEIALARINDDNWNRDRGNQDRNKGDCLYVGSSRDVLPRIRNHLGKNVKGGQGYTTTYALHLADWIWEINPGQKVLVDIWKLNLDENSPYLQIIEDILWDHYRPLFGRRGEK